jgi:predicted RNase H-like HicB family nuclease
MAHEIRQHTSDPPLTTYTFKVVVEPDGDAWYAYCPALKGYGAVTWGETRAEALRHVREVVEVVVAELVEDGEPLPADAGVSSDPLVAVTVWADASSSKRGRADLTQE